MKYPRDGTLGERHRQRWGMQTKSTMLIILPAALFAILFPAPTTTALHVPTTSTIRHKSPLFHRNRKASSLCRENTFGSPITTKSISFAKTTAKPKTPFRHCDLSRLWASDKSEEAADDDQQTSKHLLVLLNDELFDEDDRDRDELIRFAMSELEAKGISDDYDDPSSRFESLLGLYQVTSVVKPQGNEGDNPVGGKWTRKGGFAQKLFRTRTTFQHLLPFNSTGLSMGAADGSPGDAVAEAVNVISLEALRGFLRVTVMLRGDAIPLTAEERANMTTSTDQQNKVGSLSDRTVRAYFDPPRIVFGKHGRICNLNVGPKTSVVLDAPYVDDQLRIGKGGTSGTRFVFARCKEEDMEEANEFRGLLMRRPARRRNVVSVLGSVLGMGVYMNVRKRGLFWGARALGGVGSVVAGLLMAVVLFSGGGIEEDDRSARDGRMKPA